MSNVDNKLISQAEYARRRGCSRNAVSVAARAGRISVFGDHGMVNAALADAQWPRRPERMAPPPRSEPAAEPADDDAPAGGPAYAASRARREAAAAGLAELQLGRERGDLLLSAEVVAAVAGAATVLRARLEGLPEQLAQRLVQADEQRARAVLADAIGDALTELTRAFASIAAGTDRTTPAEEAPA